VYDDERRLREGGFIAEPSLKLLLQHMGFNQVREVHEMKTIEVEGGYIAVQSGTRE
jgi:hypothetical protein